MGQIDKEKYLDKGPPILTIILTLVAYAIISIGFTFIGEYFLYEVGLADPKGWIDRLFTPILLAVGGGVIGYFIGTFLCNNTYGVRYVAFGRISIAVLVAIGIAIDISACIPGVLSTLFPNSSRFAEAMICGLSAFTYSFCCGFACDLGCFSCSYCGIANIMKFSHSENEKISYERRYKEKYNRDYDSSLSDKETKATIVINGQSMKINTNPQYYKEDIGLYETTTRDNIWYCPICGHKERTTGSTSKKISD